MEHGYSNCPYSNLRIETCDNGYKVCYSEKKPSMGASSMEHVEYSFKEYVYTEKEFKAACDKFKEVSDCIMEYKKKG
jgi:hypothetical protein